MGYGAQNKAAIQRGLDRLRNREDEIVRNGMYGLLNAALEYLHQAHEGWMHHENEDDTLGWALVRDGQILEIASQSKGELTPRGDAIGRLEAIASGTKGWTGIVLSDMDNSWYRVDWEMNFLHVTADEVRDNFSKFFKPTA